MFSHRQLYVALSMAKKYSEMHAKIFQTALQDIFCEKTVTNKVVFTSRPFLKNGGRYRFGFHRRIRCLRRPRRLCGCFALYIAVAIKASSLKLGMCNICKNNIAKMFLDFLPPWQRRLCFW